MRPKTPVTPVKSLTKKKTTPNSALKKAAVPKKTTNKAETSKQMGGELFLEELEQLNCKGRWQKSVEMGRAARAGGAECKEMALLLKLSQSDVPYERLVAAMGMTQTDCANEVARLAKDRCDRVAAAAMMPAATILPDSAILELFGELPSKRLWRLCSCLERRGKLPALVDTYIATGPPPEGNSPTLTLLCWASETVLAAQSPSVLRRLGERALRTITRRYPKFATELIEGELKHDANGKSVRGRTHVVLASMRRYHPLVGLEFLATVLNYVRVDNVCLLDYARRFPVVVADLVLKHKLKNVFGHDFINKVEPEKLIALFDAGATCYGSANDFFVNAPRKVRALFFASRSTSLRETNGSIADYVVGTIPDSVEREREAMRALTEVKELQANPAVWLSYITFLPFSNALKMGDQHLRSKDVDIRANACSALVGTGLYHPNYLGHILAFCVEREKENDVVRRRMICALSDLPPSRWKEHHYPQLLKILQGALNAKDASGATLEGGLRLVLRTAPFNHTLVDALLIKFLKQGAWLPSIEHFGCPKSTVVYLWTCLLPLLKEKLCSGNLSLDCVLANFGPCLRVVGDSAKSFLLEMCKFRGRIALAGITKLLLYFKPTAMELLPNLLREEAGWVHVEAVQYALSASIQGKLLERYLVPIHVKGPFASGCGEVLIVFKDGYLWTGKKQEMYAQSISQYLTRESDGKRVQEKLLSALKVLYSANVTEAIAPFVNVSYKDIPLRDTAIELLGHLEDAASLDVLLNAFDDDRARVAIRAAHRRLSCLSGPEVIKTLKGALYSTSVSLRKEAIYILGDVGGQAVYDFLNELRKSEKLHIDVYAVLISVMFNFVERKEVWDIFLEAAKSPKSALANPVVSVPSDILYEDWQYVCLDRLLAQLLDHEDVCVVLKALNRLSEHPLCYQDKEVLGRMFQILRSPSNPAYFEPTVHALVLSKADASDVASALVEFQEDSVVQRAAGFLLCTPGAPRARFVDIVSAVVSKLLESGRQSSVACRLICVLPFEQFSMFLYNMSQRDLLHPGAVITLSQQLRCHNANIDDVDAMEEQLRQHNQPYMQRIGLTMLCAAASHASWDTRRREALKVYCRASDVWVSDDAKLVSLPSDKK